MEACSLSTWKEIASRGTSGDQVMDILQSWEAQNKLLDRKFMEFYAYVEEHGDRRLLSHKHYGELFREIHHILASNYSVIDIFPDTNTLGDSWTKV